MEAARRDTATRERKLQRCELWRVSSHEQQISLSCASTSELEEHVQNELWAEGPTAASLALYYFVAGALEGGAPCRSHGSVVNRVSTTDPFSVRRTRETRQSSLDVQRVGDVFLFVDCAQQWHWHLPVNNVSCVFGDV